MNLHPAQITGAILLTAAIVWLFGRGPRYFR